MGEIEPLLDKQRFIVSDVDEIDRHLVRWLKHKGVVYSTDSRVKRGPSKKREVTVWEWKHTVRKELKEYREEEREEALDTLAELGAERDEYADEGLDAIEEEIDRRKEVLDSADADVSVKGINAEPSESTDSENESRAGRTFGRGYSA
jgi:hypothetical protein